MSKYRQRTECPACGRDCECDGLQMTIKSLMTKGQVSMLIGLQSNKPLIHAAVLERMDEARELENEDLYQVDITIVAELKDLTTKETISVIHYQVECFKKGEWHLVVDTENRQLAEVNFTKLSQKHPCKWRLRKRTVVCVTEQLRATAPAMIDAIGEADQSCPITKP